MYIEESFGIVLDMGYGSVKLLLTQKNLKEIWKMLEKKLDGVPGIREAQLSGFRNLE